MDLSPETLAFGIIFGSMGFAVMQIGRKREDAKKILIGVILMAMTFVLGGDWYVWVVATILLVLAFYP